MKTYWVHLTVVVLSAVLGFLGLAAAVAVALREARWGLGHFAEAGTVLGGLAWAVLFVGLSLCLDLLVDLHADRAT
jgi:hypothetical protein